MSNRIEFDSLGPVAIPSERYWGPQTQRALLHFAISNERMPIEFLRALAQVKRAAAVVNGHLGVLQQDKADAIYASATEILSGNFDREFPLNVWQSGSGTQTNMNMNEVLANRASEMLSGTRPTSRLVHPNDDVNLGQSSNDVIITAMHMAAAQVLVERVQPAAERLRDSLHGKAHQYDTLIKVGRTHLQDAIPLTLGQALSAYVAQIDCGTAAIRSALNGLFALAIGGTAVGTGLNTHPRFGLEMVAQLRQDTGLPLRDADNKFAIIAAHESMVIAHAALRGLACALFKIANDLRWLASGPRCGLGEVRLPANEPGSSIMPGKVNPTQCEVMLMVSCQVMANDVAVGQASALGNLELNTFRPLIIQNYFQSARLLADAMVSFEHYCVRDMAADEQRITQSLQQSLMLVTALVPHIGYDKAATIARKAHIEKTDLKTAALSLGYVSEQEFDAWTDPATMI